MAPGDLAGRIETIVGVSVEADDDAVALFRRARGSLDEDEILVVAGSFYLAGEILRERYPGRA